MTEMMTPLAVLVGTGVLAFTIGVIRLKQTTL